jgi:transposase-like protein
VELSYEDERLYQICTECEGNIGPESTERTPVGTLIVYDDFNPAGLTHRTAGEVFVAGSIEYIQGVKMLIRGVCPECSGPIEESVNVCDTHEAPSGELCSNCGTAVRSGGNEVRVSYVCSVCKHGASYPAWTAVFDHPAIVAFYHDHGFSMTYGLDDPEVCGRLFDRFQKDQTLVSTDPLRVHVTVSCGGREMYLTLDEDLTVIEISHDDGSTDQDTSDDVSISVPRAKSRNSSSVHNKGSVDGLDLPETEECLQELRRHRWPNGIICPHCDSPDTIKKGTTSKDAQRYKCHSCGRKFNDLTGTLFAGHRLSLPEMFHIIRETDDTETAQIARRLGRSYKAVLEFVHETRDIRTRDTESTGIAAAL